MTDDVLSANGGAAAPASAAHVPLLGKRDAAAAVDDDERRDVLPPLASAERDTAASGSPTKSPAAVSSRRISFHLYDKEGSVADSRTAVDSTDDDGDPSELPDAVAVAGRRLRRLVSAPGAPSLHRTGRARTVSEGDAATTKPPAHAATMPILGAAAKSSAEDMLERLSPSAAPRQRRIKKYYRKQEEMRRQFAEDQRTLLAYEHRHMARTATAASAPGDAASAAGAATVGGDAASAGRQSLTANSVAGADSLRTAIEMSDNTDSKAAKAKRRAVRMAQLSVLVNVLLLIAKLTATLLSGSYSIISSLVDSIVDLTSGAVIWYTERAIRTRDPYEYPRGRTRLEPLALIIISVVMAVASIQVIVQSTEAIVAGHIELHVSLIAIGLMLVTIAAKFTLMVLCSRAAAAAGGDPACTVLAQDHRNDCVSNSVAIVCAVIGDRLWRYADPIGAILVSIYIVATWFHTGYEQIVMLSGKSAPPDLINRIIRVCLMHDERVRSIDTVLVYHFGSKFLVEVHIVLDGDMTLRESHDLSEPLQNKLEALDWVERAFVHNDYDSEHRPEDEHKIV